MTRLVDAVLTLPTSVPGPAEPADAAAEAMVTNVPAVWYRPEEDRREKAQNAARPAAAAAAAGPLAAVIDLSGAVEDDPSVFLEMDPAIVASEQSVIAAAIQLLSQHAGFATVSSINEVAIGMLSRVLDHPSEDKYRLVQTNNAFFHNKVGKWRGGLELMCALGFVEADGLLMLSEQNMVLLGARLHLLRSNLADLQRVRQREQEADARMREQEQASSIPTAVCAPAPGPGKRVVSRDVVADAAERRIKNLPAPVGNSQPVRGAGIDNWLQSAGLRKQIADIRAKKHDKYRATAMGRKRVWTVDDLAAKVQEDRRAVANFGGGSSSSDKRFVTLADGEDPTAIGKEALRLTNEFRKAHKLPALAWHQKIADIGAIHSKNMGDYKAPFSHDGFDARVKAYPFPSRGAAENLAMSGGLPNPAKVAVDGWIDSPGHRKNLLSYQTWCGIGCYKGADGKWWLTQLFALE